MWSEAARKASADARRLHRKAKNTMTLGEVNSTRTAHHVRDQIAKHMRELRSGRYKGDATKLVRTAVASSTALRRQRRGKMPWPGTGGMSPAEKLRLLARRNVR